MHIHGVWKSGYKLPPFFWGRACTISIHPSMARGCSIIITPDGVTSNGGEGGTEGMMKHVLRTGPKDMLYRVGTEDIKAHTRKR